MKLTLCICIWIFIFDFLKTDKTQNCAQSQFSQILTRRKRFLTFPSGSSFAVKRSFTKSVLENIPRGLSLTVDIGVYYPLPVSVDAWNLEKLLYRLDLSHTGGLSATPKPKKGNDLKPKANLKNESSDIVNPVKYHWVDHKLYFNSYEPEVYFDSAKWNGPGNHYSKHTYNNLPWRRQYDISQTTLNNQTDEDPQYIPLHWNTFEGRIHQNEIQQPYQRKRRRGKRLPFSFEPLASIFKVNIKACIMRAICELNDDPFPSGKSLIMDTAKIFFDVTVNRESEDEVARSSKEQNVDCAKRFFVSCPYSPFDFFNRNLRLKFNDRDVIKRMSATA